MIHLAFPAHKTDKIRWIIDFHRQVGLSRFQASLSRILSPAENEIGLYIPGPGDTFDHEDIVGNLRRGPDNTLLLDIQRTQKYPQYDNKEGIPLIRTSETLETSWHPAPKPDGKLPADTPPSN